MAWIKDTTNNSWHNENKFFTDMAKNDLLSYCVYTDKFFEVQQHQEVIASKLQDFMEGKIKRLILMTPPRSWKLVAHNTPILTSIWWINHWDLEVWDYVFNWEWKQVKVLALSKEDYADYEITFSTWETIKTHWNHEWYIYSRNHHKYIIKETKDLINIHRNNLRWVRGSGFNYWIDFAKPLDFEEKELLINPYVLWVWLWDWTKSKDCITQSKEDINNTKELFEERWYIFRREDIHKDTWVYTAYFNDLLPKIKKLWLYNNKHIPREYIENSIENRLELLRWLLDSDWHIDKTWRIKFSNINIDLINWIEEIIKSLWYRVEKTNAWKSKEHLLNWHIIKSNKDIYVIAFTPYNNMKFFNLKRKLEKQKIWKYRKNYIINIEKTHYKELWRCIQVEWWLYLVWKDLILTHNSRLVCEAISRWMWKLSNTDIIYTWHSLWLLEWFSRNIRTRFTSQEHQAVFNNKIKWDNAAVNQWSTDNWNQLMIYWVGWWITGKWWHRLIIDDPYATREDAESDTIRKKVKSWYDSTFYSRRHNQHAWICIIMQRWREDDLIGDLIEQDWEEWEVVKIPAIDDNWISFRPNRFSVEELNNMRKKIWDYFFMSQYQQEPYSDTSWAFLKEYFQYYRLEDLYVNWKIKPEYLIATFLDPAISQKQEADNTAIVTVAINQKTNDIYLLDVFADRIQPDNIIENLFRIVDKFKPNKVWIEIVAYQKMLALEIRKQMKIRNKFFVLEEVNPSWEKQARILSWLQARYSNKSVYHLVEHKDLENELLKFPNWKHDDRIDAEAWAFRILDTICNYATEPVQPIRTDLETKKTNEDFSFNTYHKKLLSKSTNEYDEKGDIIESVVFW